MIHAGLDKPTMEIYEWKTWLASTRVVKMVANFPQVRAYTSGVKEEAQTSNLGMLSTCLMEREETRKDWPYIITWKVTPTMTEFMFT